MEHEDLIRENLMLKDQLGQLGKTLADVNTAVRIINETRVGEAGRVQEKERALLETIVGLRVRGSLLKQRTRRMGETLKTCRRLLSADVVERAELQQLIGRIDEILEAHQ